MLQTDKSHKLVLATEFQLYWNDIGQFLNKYGKYIESFSMNTKDYLCHVAMLVYPATKRKTFREEVLRLMDEVNNDKDLKLGILGMKKRKERNRYFWDFILYIK